MTPARATHGAWVTAKGTYRMPYADGTTFYASNDHHTHGGPTGAKDCFELVADNPLASVVAASSSCG